MLIHVCIYKQTDKQTDVYTNKQMLIHVCIDKQTDVVFTYVCIYKQTYAYAYIRIDVM